MLKSYFILKSEEVFGLPNIKSAKKRVLVSQTKAMQNKAVDKAAAKGLLHKNNAAHKKSSMTIKLSKLA